MNSVNLRRFGNPQDGFDIKVGADRAIRAAQGVGFVRLGSVKRTTVLLGIYCNRLNAELRRRPKNANRDFRSVGNE